ncbi:SRPBCC family protein [Streptomyces sp. NPDC059991]|uniref:SRPBCC family protein n=1 Tax=Streptomyces sp. NPDC059991 TaxID=3347028 RepID=UPI0036A3DFBE
MASTTIEGPPAAPHRPAATDPRLPGSIGWLRERITRYDPPYATEYVVERSLPPSRHELGREELSEVDDGTLVRWTTRAEIPVPLVGAFLTRRLARPIITRAFRDILETADAALTQLPRPERA